MAIEIGIIGGSGFYSLLEKPKSIGINTKYGSPSDKIHTGIISGKNVAFIPRHGSKHTYPPHKVPYKANIEALHKLGVKRIIATNAVGSLNPEFKIGQIVAFDQFVNMTSNRSDTFFEESVAHVSMADPYCSEMRKTAHESAKRMKLNYNDKGTVLVINGPRFSTRSESLFYQRQGFDLINMTQYPEVALAREKCICYLALGIVTDYDAGLIGKKNIKPVSHKEVMETFSKNIGNVKALIKNIVANTKESRKCICSNALDDAVIPV
ncbi:MAG: S-methyl-5'-thioadenosine phosphorylase [Candidatus Micrarchaeaceae archaeon]|jgi:5'-methylthioadenosine phosphorylase